MSTENQQFTLTIYNRSTNNGHTGEPTRKTLVKNTSWLFSRRFSCKKAMFTFHWWRCIIFFCARSRHVELTTNTLFYSQLSYEVFVLLPTFLLARKKHCKLFTSWTGKQRETNTLKELPKSKHLIMSLFTLFCFVASMEIWAYIRK